MNFIVIVFYIDVWTNSNTTSRALPVVTFFENHSFKIDKYQSLTEDKSFINGHYYSDKAPLPTLITIPFFGIAKGIGLVKEIDGSLHGKEIYTIGTLICSMIPFLLILILTFYKVNKNSSVSPVFLTVLPFFGSFIFIFAGTFFNHLISALFLLLAYIFLKEKKFFAAGIFIGLGFLCEYITLLVATIWFFQILANERKIKPLFSFGLGVVPALIFLMIYNYLFTGSPFLMLYKFHTYQELHTNYGFSHPTLQSLWGLTFSQYKGLFFYAPFLIICLVYAIKLIITKSISEVGRFLLTNYLIIPSLAIIFLVSSYFGWWGGWTYGPRLFLFIAVLLVYEGVIFMSNRSFSKWFFWLLIGWGLFCTFADKITLLYSIPSECYNPISELIIPLVLNLKLNSNNILTMLFNLSPISSFLVWLLFFVGSISFLAIFFKKVNKEI